VGPTEWIKEMTTKKTPWSSISMTEQKTYNPFIMNLWLSMNPDWLEIVNEVQSQQVPNRDHYNFYKGILPKKQPFFRWIKASKKEYSKDVIDKLAIYYSCSSREIIDSLCILTEQNISDILMKMGISDKEIKKMLK